MPSVHSSPTERIAPRMHGGLMCRWFDLAPLMPMVRRLQQCALTLCTAAILTVGAWPGGELRAQVSARESVAMEKALAAQSREAAVASLAASLEAVASELRRIKPFGEAVPAPNAIVGFTGDRAPLSVAEKVLAAAGDMGDLPAVLEQQWREEAAELAAAGFPAAVITRGEAALNEMQRRAREFQALLAAVREANAQRSAIGASNALAALAEWQKSQTTAKGYRALGDADLPLQLTRVADAPSINAALLAESKDGTDTVSAAASVALKTPTPADLAETVEVRFTPEITQLAQSLGGPVPIRNFVYNEIEFVPTFGATQSAALTLLNRRGTAADIASLSIALLRRAGIPARYAHGVVEVPIERLQNWIDAPNPTQALELLQKGGVPASAVIQGGRLAAVRMEHVWAEAYVDFIPSRAEVNRVPDSWVPIDPAYKQFDVDPGLPIIQDATPARLAAIEAFAQSIEIDSIRRLRGFDFDALDQANKTIASSLTAGYLAQDPTLRGDDLYDRRSIRPISSAILEGTLPLVQRSAVQRYSELPNTLRHRLRVLYYPSQVALDGDAPAQTLETPLARVGTGAVDFDFDPATTVDAQALANFASSNAAQLNPSLINVRPRLRAGGEVLFEGTVTRMGEAHYLRVDIRAPNGFIGRSEAYKVITGSPTVFVVNPVGITPGRTERETASLPEGAARYAIKQALYLGGLTYWLLHDFTDDQVARSVDGRGVRLPSIGAFSKPYQIGYFFGIPRRGFQNGLTTDVKAVRFGLTVANPQDYLQASLKLGSAGSLAEGATWALNGGTGGGGGGLSTTTIMRQALDEGQALLVIDASNAVAALAAMQLSADAEAEISQSVTRGQIALATERDIGYRGWQGTGYVIFDPVSGSSLQRVEGGLAGGIEIGCQAQAVSLTELANKKLLARAQFYLAHISDPRLVEGFGLQRILAGLAPGQGTALPVVGAVILGIALAYAHADINRWLQLLQAGAEKLTPEEMAFLGVSSVEEIECNTGTCPPSTDSGPDERGIGLPLLGNPVVVGTGAKWQTETDYLATGPFPLKFTRAYYSKSPHKHDTSRWIKNYHSYGRRYPAPIRFLDRMPDWFKTTGAAGIGGALVAGDDCECN